MIQDIEPKHLYNEWKKNAVPKKSSAVVQFRGQDLLCRIDDNGLKFPSRAQFTEPDEAFTNRPGAQRTALVAGFTEFAESFEQTVHREVMEEVGLKVKDLRYYRCQPWGISGNIMMGYWCRLDGDDDTIHLDNFELADGAWVSREELRENYTGNGIALTSEMIAEFAAGRDPYSLEKNK